MGFAPGQMVGPYRITERLGKGGMGEVYRARHTVLGRDVALKTILLGRGGTEVLHRFLHEARAVSALQHPNIVTLYDIGEYEGMPYIAMEFVEGVTVAELIRRNSLTAGDAVRYAIQMACALNAAHRAGIVHRDVKPTNIMVNRSDVVKVLDFGLAKALEPEAGSTERNEETRTLEYQTELTGEGQTAGTPGYMSPEQVEGRRLDARSDIFSFGAVLYEMLSGRRAFQGSSTASTLAQVIRDDPTQVEDGPLHAHPELEEVVRLCLRKNPEERAQSMHDVACMLEITQRRAGLARMPAPPPPNRVRRLAVACGMAAAGAALAGGLAWWRLAGGGAKPQATLRRITWDTGLDLTPAISSDGRLLAFASDRGVGGGLDIFVRHTSGGEPVRVTSNPADDLAPSFSPDGGTIAFQSVRDGGGVYVVPTLGGTERLIAPGGQNPSFSPDGQWIAYWVGDPSNYVSGRLFVVPATGGVPRQLQPSFAYARYPCFTPDGAHILFEGEDTPKASDRSQSDWWVAPLEGGRAVKTGVFDYARRSGLRIYEPGGWRNGRVVFSGRSGNTRSLFEIPISPGTWRAEGPPEPLTIGTGVEAFPQTSPSGQIAFSSMRYEINIWARHIDAGGRVLEKTDHKLTAGGAYHSSPSLSGDDRRIAYLTGARPTTNVWVSDTHTGRETAVTLDSSDKCGVALRADGRRVAWSVCGQGPGSIFAADLSADLTAAPPQELCEDCGRVIEWSNSGDRLLYVNEAAPASVGILTLAGGARVSMASSRLVLDGPRLSPDEKWLAVSGSDSGGARLYVVPLTDGRPAPESQWIAVTDGKSWDDRPVWSADGQALLFLSKRDGFRCIWRQGLNPVTKRPEGAPAALIDYHTSRLSMGDLQANVKSLLASPHTVAYGLLESTGSIWVYEPPNAGR